MPFHIYGIVPSVAFMIDILKSAKDSFFQGKACGVVKDKVSQASSALRHSAELRMIIEQEVFKAYFGDSQ